VSLTSPALPYLLAALSAGLLIGIVLGWRAMAGRNWRAVAMRAASLVTLQACVLSWIFVTANRSGEFYSSWSDLFGSVNGSGKVAAPGHPASVSLKPLVVTSTARVKVAGLKGSGGTLETVTFNGQTSGLSVPGHIYLPAGYRPGAQPGGYPVIVDISNSAASPVSPYGAIRLAESTAREIAAGNLRPVIVAMVPAALSNADQGCLNLPAQSRAGSPATAATQAQSFFTQDIPATLESAYRASTSRARWALLGDTTGGYCALQLTLANSWDFSVAVAPRGNYTRPPGASGAGTSPQFRRQDNLIWLLANQPMQPVSVLFAGPGTASSAGPASPFLAMARHPMRVSSTGLGSGSWPLAPVLDWIGRAIGGQAPVVTAG
jgi:hypothetical protein